MIGDTRTALNYRLHAEELRTIADGMADTNTRKVLLSIAEEYERLWMETDPWAGIPKRYNLGHALTRGNVEAGRGEQLCLSWENSAGEQRQFTYAQMDEASSRFASNAFRSSKLSGLLRSRKSSAWWCSSPAAAPSGDRSWPLRPCTPSRWWCSSSSSSGG